MQARMRSSVPSIMSDGMASEILHMSVNYELFFSADLVMLVLIVNSKTFSDKYLSVGYSVCKGKSESEDYPYHLTLPIPIIDLFFSTYLLSNTIEYYHHVAVLSNLFVDRFRSRLSL